METEIDIGIRIDVEAEIGGEARAETMRHLTFIVIISKFFYHGMKSVQCE